METAGDDGARMLQHSSLTFLSTSCDSEYLGFFCIHAITGTQKLTSVCVWSGYCQVNFTYTIKFCLGNSKWHQFQQRHSFFGRMFVQHVTFLSNVCRVKDQHRRGVLLRIRVRTRRTIIIIIYRGMMYRYCNIGKH